jgi:Mrp family chromosome partitioning ATPase
MIKIAVWSQKGGVGKSTVTAYLGLALRDMGKKVGLLDIDLSGSSLHKALGLDIPPRLGTSTARRKLIPPEVMGLHLFSICAHFGEENAVMWKGETGIVEIPDEVMESFQEWFRLNPDIEARLKQFLDQNVDIRTSFRIAQEPDVFERPTWYLRQTYVSNRAEVIRQMLSSQVEWPEDTDILLADMPPSTASEVFSFFEHMENLRGVIIVTQPSDISALGMTRTIDFLKQRQIPIMGLVTMMDGYLCPSCGTISHQLLSPRLDMEKVARECGIPFLVSIPQTPEIKRLKPYFDSLARMVLRSQPITLRRQTLKQKLQEKAGELGVKAASKFM